MIRVMFITFIARVINVGTCPKYSGDPFSGSSLLLICVDWWLFVHCFFGTDKVRDDESHEESEVDVGDDDGKDKWAVDEWQCEGHKVVGEDDREVLVPFSLVPPLGNIKQDLLEKRKARRLRAIFYQSTLGLRYGCTVLVSVAELGVVDDVEDNVNEEGAGHFCDDDSLEVVHVEGVWEEHLNLMIIINLDGFVFNQLIDI
jgi:hypothetical protein